MAKIETWQDVLDGTAERIRQGNGFALFSALETNEERVRFCLRHEVAHPRIKHWLAVLCSSKHRKFWEKASELRSEGNICFNRKQFAKAAEFYTQSILSAPFPDTPDAEGHAEEISLGFANRSAAYFHAGKYKRSLCDVRYAIELGYPNHLRYKLYLRKGQCYLRLGKPREALENFDLASKALRRAGLDSRKHAQQAKEIDLFKQACTANQTPPVPSDEDDPDDESQVPSVAHGVHDSVPNCTSAVDILYSTEKGRFVVANRDLRTGDAIFVEKPYASVLLPGHTKTHCHHCHKRLQNAVPCSQCNQVRYCTFSCAKESWSVYHQWECGNLNLLYSVGIAHLAIRILLVTGLANLTQFYRALAEGDDEASEYSYNTVYELVTHSEKMYADDMLQYSLTAALLYLLLDQVQFFNLDDVASKASMLSLSGRNGSNHHSGLPVKEPNLAALKTFAGGLLLRHIQQLVCNAHAITSLESRTTQEDDVVVTTEQVRIATAIYPSASLMNHACSPNIISNFPCGSTLVVRAVRKIAAGEEVLNCYGPHYQRMSFAERRQTLQEQYFFTCGCTACNAGEDAEQRLQALKCEYCDGPLNTPDDGGKAACLDCGTTQECLAREQKAFRMHDLYVQGVQLAEKGNHLEALQRLNKCLKAREKLMYKHNLKLLEAKDMVAKCFCAIGDFRSACDVLRPAVDAIREIYGENSIELANELQKLSDVLVNAVPQAIRQEASAEEIDHLIRDADAVIDEAMTIYILHYGRRHHTTRDLQAKRRMLATVS
ncbi:protein-lysine N-methyltransferase SMYD4-like [Amblyomma americanum]